MEGWASPDVEPVPFTLLGGYLGAGKTTLLNRLLADTTSRLVVLVNDVGAVNVDAALVADHDGPTLTLTNGCVCCAITDDFGATLEQVRSLPDRPDRVVMELSGVAEPARLAAWANTTGFRLDGIVVVADAEQVVELTDRRYVGDTVRAQLSAADLVVLTKTDLVSDTSPARVLIGGLTSAPLFDAAEVDPAALFGADRSSVARPGSPRPTGEPGGVTDRHRVGAVTVSGATRAELAALVDGLAQDVVRAKGLIRCADTPAPVEVQVVGRRRLLRDRPDLGTDVGGEVLVVIRAPLLGPS